MSADILRVGVDARCLNVPHLRGMGKYVSEMLAHVDSREAIEWHFFSDRPECVFQRPRGIEGRVDLFDFPGYRVHAWEQIGLPWRAWLAGVDLLHCTATTLPYWQPVPTVVTIHDMLPWQERPAGSYDRWYLNRLVPAALAKCSAIITISESSQADILNFWPNLADKLHVVPHGISDTYLHAADHPISEDLGELIGPGPFFLYVGGTLARKRFSWALRVVESLRPAEVTLVACGFSDQERADVMSNLAPATRQWLKILPFVREADMPALYRRAAAVLYPTLYEGFGFPALEAQTVGTSVLFSALGSLRELDGPLARILPPNDHGAWVNTCKAILEQPATGRSAADAARQWAQKFSWSVSANRHVELYRRTAAMSARGKRAQQT